MFYLKNPLLLACFLLSTPVFSSLPTAAPTERPNEDDAGVGAIFAIFMIIWIVFPAGAVLREYQQGKKLEAEKRKLVQGDTDFNGDKKMRIDERFKMLRETPSITTKDLYSIGLAHLSSSRRMRLVEILLKHLTPEEGEKLSDQSENVASPVRNRQ